MPAIRHARSDHRSRAGGGASTVEFSEGMGAAFTGWVALLPQVWKSSNQAEVRIMRADIVAGAMFPDYQLPDQTGTMRRLSELQGIDPMIVVLSRGGF